MSYISNLSEKVKSSTTDKAALQKAFLLKAKGDAGKITAKKTLKDDFKDYFLGIGKSALKTVRGGSAAYQRYVLNPAFDLAQKAESMKYGTAGKLSTPEIASEKLIPESAVTAKNTAQSLGMFTGDVAQYLIPGGASTKVSKLLGGGLLARAGTEALVGGGVSLAQEGKLNENVATNAVLSGALPITFTALGKGYNVGKNTLSSLFTTLGKAKMSGVNEMAINTIKEAVPNLDDATVKKIIQSAEDSSKSLESIKPRDIVGNDLKTAKTTLEKNLDSAGQVIESFTSNAATKFKDKAPLTSAYDEFIARIRKLNVKVKRNGMLDFSNSDIADLPSDQNLLTGIFDKLRPLKGGDRKGFIRDVIAFRRNIGNKIYQGNASGDLTASEGVASGVYGKLNEIVSGYAEKTGNESFIKANQVFGDSSDLLMRLTKSIGKEGENSGQIIRRLFSNTGGKERELLDELISKGDSLNLGFLKNIKDKAKLATITEEVFNVKQPTGMENIVSRGVESVTKPKTGVVVGILDKLASKAIGTKEENFVKLVAEELKKETGLTFKEDIVKKIINKNYGSFSELLKTQKERFMGIPTIAKPSTPSMLLQ